MAEKRILIGEIATAHGIKGYVKVRSFVEDGSLLESERLYTGEDGDKTLSLTLKNPLKADWVAEVSGITDRNGAEKLRGTKLYIDRADLPETDEDDGAYYIEDLKGLRVIDASEKEIGIVLGVENYGASDLLDIKPPAGEAFYIPFTDDTVIGIDMDRGVIIVEMPETV